MLQSRYILLQRRCTPMSRLQILSQHVTQSNSVAVTENLRFFPTLVGERFGRAFKIGATVSPNLTKDEWIIVCVMCTLTHTF